MSARENAGAPLPRLDADVIAEVRALRDYASARMSSFDSGDRPTHTLGRDVEYVDTTNTIGNYYKKADRVSEAPRPTGSYVTTLAAVVAKMRDVLDSILDGEPTQ